MTKGMSGLRLVSSRYWSIAWESERWPHAADKMFQGGKTPHSATTTKNAAFGAVGDDCNTHSRGWHVLTGYMSIYEESIPKYVDTI